jgi:hypothetical protein
MKLLSKKDHPLSQVCSGWVRYLRPTVETQQQPSCGDSQPDPNTTSSGDECSTSAATSGEEVWGTPTSGGELDEELVFPSTVSVSISTLNGVHFVKQSWFCWSKVSTEFQFSITITALHSFPVNSISVMMLLNFSSKAWGIPRLWMHETASSYG